MKTSFEGLLKQLSDKESYVITHRIGLYGHKETLQEIGDNYSITRERVRQIEDKGVKSIGGMIKDTPLSDVQMLAGRILHEQGGIMSRDDLVSALIKELAL
jgi:RNA polymerase primary sigma factor